MPLGTFFCSSSGMLHSSHCRWYFRIRRLTTESSRPRVAHPLGYCRARRMTRAKMRTVHAPEGVVCQQAMQGGLRRPAAGAWKKLGGKSARVARTRRDSAPAAGAWKKLGGKSARVARTRGGSASFYSKAVQASPASASARTRAPTSSPSTCPFHGGSLCR